MRFRGADITYLDAERRLRLGITQIPGGRAVFGPMTVVENLRGFGYTLGRDRQARRRRDRRVLRGVPAAGRAPQPERQHAVGRRAADARPVEGARSCEPQLLLIDELSLGLAPVIVGQLLDMVREINADGTAVVLVEQSVNIALNLVDHAYFMEKGEIRFDGAAPTCSTATTCCAPCSSRASGPRKTSDARPRRRGASRSRCRSSCSATIIGMTYGLLAVGLVLVYRTNRIINFAHGEIGAFGAAFFGTRGRALAHPVLRRAARSRFAAGRRHRPRWPRSRSSAGCATRRGS